MRSPKKKPFSDSRINSKFKVKNWPKYNDSLRRRGRIDFMISENLCDGWHEDNHSNRKTGRQKTYSDQAIIQVLQIRCLFGLKLRQTQGFLDCIFQMCGLDIKCPDYTTISKRSKKLNIKFEPVRNGEEVNHVAIDSSGIQTYTGNEWLENKHGKQYIRRTWKKIHIVVDDKGFIVANATTEHNVDDRSQVSELLTDINTKEFLADPGYDGESMYQFLRGKGIKPTIRPPNSHAASQAAHVKTERDIEVEYQQGNGYQAWRVKNNYGRRESVENTFFRFKSSFGSQFLSRGIENMKNEITIKCQLLNKMFHIGKPISVRTC
ncbi:IS5 family transposase (plasmid) [Candidatus Megaera polyxenophila]|uniref:IS5 family transposase n=1 Tax=Candidatus Megaera polyxenophila TaxID=988779 RepID=UPI00249E9886|nr:IS5 family transposase [Candidatus Megaera polyxenophila]